MHFLTTCELCCTDEVAASKSRNKVRWSSRQKRWDFSVAFLVARFGKVDDAVVMYDKKTGRSRGFGFITYDNPDVVRKVNFTRSGFEQLNFTSVHVIFDAVNFGLPLKKDLSELAQR